MAPARYTTLGYFCQFLHELLQSATDSQMDARNLSICIGPKVFMSPTPDATETLGETLRANIALEVVIRQYPLIFDDFTSKGFRPEDLCTDDNITKFAAIGRVDNGRGNRNKHWRLIGQFSGEVEWSGCGIFGLPRYLWAVWKSHSKWSPQTVFLPLHTFRFLNVID
jgi:hypothetical protein